MVPAGGGRGLDGAGELGAVAGALHHGDGDGAGAHGVGHGGAGGHALKGGGDDGHLGRAAGSGARHAVCKVDEEVRDARALQNF